MKLFKLVKPETLSDESEDAPETLSIPPSDKAPANVEVAVDEFAIKLSAVAVPETASLDEGVVVPSPRYPLFVNLPASVAPLFPTKNFIKSVVPVAEVLCSVNPSIIFFPPIIVCPPATPPVPTKPVNLEDSKSKSERLER